MRSYFYALLFYLGGAKQSSYWRGSSEDSTSQNSWPTLCDAGPAKPDDRTLDNLSWATRVPRPKLARKAGNAGGNEMIDVDAGALASMTTAPLLRNQTVARRVLNEHYPFKCCAICGLQLTTCLTIAHLDHNAANNAPDNLARLCQTHHWMYDAGLYPIEAIKLLQAHWQTFKGVPNHKGRMKDAGAKAALTRKRRAAGRKASETRRKNAKARQ